MKIETKQENALIVGAETTTMGLNNLDSSVFVQMLIRLYQFPIEASVREALSNSWDSIIEAKVDSFPIVGLQEDKFFVQDFGTGMSPEFMLSSTEGFSTIGYSTKRESNDQLGFWGFGKVVGLSYTRDQFYLHTVWNKIAYEYLIFLDGNSIKVMPLSQKETEEPNGTRIVIQIKKGWGEKDKWIHAIKQQCAYFDKTNLDLDGTKYVVQVDRNGFLLKSSLYQDETHIVLGSVYYDIPWDKFDEWSFLKNMNLGIYIGLDEGISPVPSREAWEFNDFSKALLISKFQVITEQLYEDCNKILEELKDKKDIVKLKFYRDGLVGSLTLEQYKKICTALNKPQVQFLDETFIKDGYTREIWNVVKNSFVHSGSAPYHYSERYTPLKLNYLEGASWSKKNEKVGTLRYMVKIDCSGIDQSNSQIVNTYCREQEDLILKRLQQEYIEEFFVPFDEVGFEQWKKDRRIKKKEVSEGITYYREHLNDSRQCTEDKGTFNLSEFHYVFKASKETAQKYWDFLNSIVKSRKLKMIITKKEGYDLDKLEPSPLLKRLCSEALKAKVYSIIGKDIKSKHVLTLIQEMNPLLYQYINEIDFNITDQSQDVIEGLMEVGTLLGCFDKDEIKLRYIEYHLNKMKLIGKLGYAGGYPDYCKKFYEEDKQIIKRVYLLERLVEKKELIKEEVNENQLTLELV